MPMTDPYTRQLAAGFWGLNFRAPLESEYRVAQTQANRWHAYAISVVAAMIVAFFCLLDVHRFKLLADFDQVDAGIWTLQWVRWLTLAGLLSMLLRPSAYQRRLELRMTVVAALVAVNIIAGLTVLLPRGIPSADFGQLLVIAIFLISGLQFFTALAIAVTFVAITLFAVPMMIGAGIVDDQPLRHFMLVMALIIGAIGGYMHERGLRLQFLMQRIATHLATHDGLTGLNNRRAFESWLAAQLRSVDRQRLFVVLLDLDHFKAVNDRLGHLGGDAVLRRVARTLEGAVRPGEECAARVGGEEFVIVLADDGGEAVVRRVEKVLAEIRLRAASDDIPDGTLTRRLKITTSAGMTRCRPGDTVESVYRRADDHLYQSKHGGRDRLTSDEDPSLVDESTQHDHALA